MPWTIDTHRVAIYSAFALSEDGTFAVKPPFNEKQLPAPIGNPRSKH